MADISNSLKVVNIALVFCASFSLLAIFNLIRFIFTLCSLLVPAISVVGSAGGILSTGAAPAAGALGGIGGGWWRRWSGGDRSSRSSCSWGSCWLGATWTKLDLEKLNSGLDCAAILDQQLCDHSRSGRGHRHASLVRFYLADDLVLGHAVSNGLLPSDVAHRDGIGESGTYDHFNFFPKNPGGEDAPSHHWVLIEKSRRGRRRKDRRTRGLGGLRGEH